jgi:phage gp29-like protein
MFWNRKKQTANKESMLSAIRRRGEVTDMLSSKIDAFNVSLQDMPEYEKDKLIRILLGGQSVNTVEGNGRDVDQGIEKQKNQLYGTTMSNYVRGWLPSARIQEVRATQSNAIAHGIYYVHNVAFWDLMDEISRKDPVIAAALRLVVATILKREFVFSFKKEPDESDNVVNASSQIRDQTEKDIREVPERANFEKMLYTLAYYHLVHGFSANETIWMQKEGRFVPQAYIHRHPGLFVFDIMGKEYIIDTDRNIQASPKGKFIILDSPGAYGNPYGKSLLDDLQYTFWMKKFAIKAWAEYVDIYGVPLAKGKLNNMFHPDGDEKQQIQALLNQLEMIRRNTGIVLPKGVDLDFISRTGGQQTAPHESFIRYIDKVTIMLIYGAVLGMMDSEHQSKAATETHVGIGEIRSKPIAHSISAAITRDLVHPYLNINYTNPPNISGNIDTDDTIDVNQIMDIIYAANDWGLPVKQSQAYEWTGLERPGPKDEVLIYNSNITQSEAEKNDASPFREVRGLSKIGEVSSGKLEKVAKLALNDQKDKVIQSIRRSLIDPTREIGNRDQWPANIDRLLSNLNTDLEISLYNHSSNLLGMVLYANTIDELMPVERELFISAVDKEFLDNMPSEYSEAAIWMQDRGVMTITQARKAARVLASTGVDYKQALRIIRQENIALKWSMNVKVTDRIRNAIMHVMEMGNTWKDFLGMYDDMVESKQIFGGLDGYMQTVFRTEIGNAYGAQRDALDANPIIQENRWGYEFYNPKDESSDPTHASMDGIKVKAGSAADQLSRPGPPWRYNCRCDRLPIIIPRNQWHTMRESPNAISVISKITRF